MSLFGARRHPRTAPLPVEGRLPGFDGATGWLNSPPLTPEGLRGKVVLVDFWTYTCINWLRTLAYVRAWAEKYRDRGLVVVGVHTPEFPFEHDVDNVRWAAQDMRRRVSDRARQRLRGLARLRNQYWPAVYIADAEGRIRHHHFGEGEYEECERVIQQLLREAGRDGRRRRPRLRRRRRFRGSGRLDEPGVARDLPRLRAGAELRLPDGAAFDEPRAYVAPERLKLNQWALSGDWTIEGRASVLNEADGRIAFRFHARDVHLVMARQRARPCRSACSSTESLPATRTGSTSTSRATEPSSNRGSIS